MVFAELDRRARFERAHRTRLVVQMLTTFAYASLGISVADPVLRQTALGFGNLLALAFGLVCAGVAIYLVPEGERHGQL